MAVVGLFLPSVLVFCAGGPAAGVDFLTRALLAEIRADGKEPIAVGKVDQKRARGDILAADPALFRLNGRYPRSWPWPYFSCSGRGD